VGINISKLQLILVGVQTPAEIRELSLRTPRPTALPKWPTSC